MNLLSVSNLSKSFGTKTLFNKISFGIDHGEKVALVARNGSGKTTLFKILKGKEIADEGEVVMRKNIRVGFLDQEFVLDDCLTVAQAIESADNPFVSALRNYEAAVTLAEQQPGDKSANLLHDALELMTTSGAWDYEKNISEILGHLQIRNKNAVIGTLSGGQRKRLALALMLINQPDLLVMDEPTNHLDVEMIEWLAHYLQNAQLTLLLVTHDRYFLDEVSTRIIELENGQLSTYNGDYAYYLEKKAEKDSNLQSEIEKARNLYRRELEWVRKMPKARGTKSKSRLDAFELIKGKAFQKRNTAKVELDVKSERLGSKIVELHKITKAYGDKVIMKPFTYTFIKKEKIGIVGPNGAGKSTLLKILLGIEKPDSGKVSVGDTVVFGYYSQDGMRLDNEKRLIEVVKEIAEFIPLSNGTSLSASQLLTRFNFPPEAQYGYVSKLSGGEKRRLYLLTVLVKNPNFLILDEPTNDLDIITLQILEEFLADFAGCVVIVTHDRYFMDKLVDHIFAFEGDGVIKDFPGNYSEYRAWRSIQDDEPGEEPVKEEIKQPEKTVQEKTGKKQSYKIIKEIEDLEKDIARLETEKKAAEDKLASGITDYEEIKKTSEKLTEVSRKLDEKTMRWLELQEE
jgi:ABC transport system ATP-binding/permease protein